MSYKNVTKVLPQDLVEQIQRYVDGAYIYIPRKKENKKRWGSSTAFQEEIRKRDKQIYHDYLKGIDSEQLCETYFLSRKSIQRIVLQEKRKQV